MRENRGPERLPKHAIERAREVWAEQSRPNRGRSGPRCDPPLFPVSHRNLILPRSFGMFPQRVNERKAEIPPENRPLAIFRALLSHDFLAPDFEAVPKGS